MKNLIIIILLCGIIYLVIQSDGVKDKVQEVKDMWMEPEEIVVDYIDNIVEIFNTEQNCGKLTTDLNIYCAKREVVVTDAVRATARRLENNEISPENRALLESKVGILDSMHNPSCDSTIRVGVELLKCTTPALGLFK